MLVLTRLKGQSVMIGDDVVVTVVDFDRGKVRLGVKAPRSVRVDREEVAAARAREESDEVRGLRGGPAS